MSSGRDKIAISAGPAWRWYGAQPYSLSIGGNVDYQHPVGKRTQLRIGAGIARVNNKRNDLQDATNFSLSAGIDRAFSARFGSGFQAYATREAARDPGYSTTSGGVSTYVYRELGKTTAIISLGYSHLEADQRLFLYINRRIDNRLIATVTTTLRQFRIGSFAPLARLKFERNLSNIDIYQFNRIAAEMGITSAF